ncbi:MAG: hypothetical protein H6Q30_2675 [Bacteroidetes bacterium]|jgi:hypothetical protein|nr:hypothetical protein [Bacteroidota bacterium]
MRDHGRFRAVLFLIAAIIPWAVLWGQAQPSSRVLSEGEELVYNVRYGFFDLGSVRIRTIQRQASASTVAYYCKAFIDSYPKVPFVDLHATYESVLDTSIYSYRFVGRTKQDDWWNFSRYTFDSPHRRAILETGQKDTLITKRDTVGVDGVYQDGLSLFFFARDRLMAGKSLDIPCIVTEQKVNTHIDFDGRRDAVEIDAVDYPVDVVGFEGTADFVGVFGLTGEFDGWFSNDEARVPILARMKVIIGSVTIELMEWKRPGWNPPQAKD